MDGFIEQLKTFWWSTAANNKIPSLPEKWKELFCTRYSTPEDMLCIRRFNSDQDLDKITTRSDIYGQGTEIIPMGCPSRYVCIIDDPATGKHVPFTITSVDKLLWILVGRKALCQECCPLYTPDEESKAVMQSFLDAFTRRISNLDELITVEKSTGNGLSHCPFHKLFERNLKGPGTTAYCGLQAWTIDCFLTNFGRHTCVGSDSTDSTTCRRIAMRLRSDRYCVWGIGCELVASLEQFRKVWTKQSALLDTFGCHTGILYALQSLQSHLLGEKRINLQHWWCSHDNPITFAHIKEQAKEITYKYVDKQLLYLPDLFEADEKTYDTQQLEYIANSIFLSMFCTWFTQHVLDVIDSQHVNSVYRFLNRHKHYFDALNWVSNNDQLKRITINGKLDLTQSHLVLITNVGIGKNTVSNTIDLPTLQTGSWSMSNRARYLADIINAKDTNTYLACKAKIQDGRFPNSLFVDPYLVRVESGEHYFKLEPVETAALLQSLLPSTGVDE